MKKITRLIALVLLALTLCSLMSTALAASKTYKGTGSVSYTVTTGKKDAKLTCTNKAGKVNATVWKNLIKQTTKTKSMSHYGKFQITVKCGSDKKTITLNYPFNSSDTVTLKKNSTYSVSIVCKGFSDEIITGWNPVWKTNPSVKLSVNNSAKIK